MDAPVASAGHHGEVERLLAAEPGGDLQRLAAVVPQRREDVDQELAVGDRVPDLQRGVPSGEHRQVVLVEVDERLGVVGRELLLRDLVDPRAHELAQELAPGLSAHGLGDDADRGGFALGGDDVINPYQNFAAIWFFAGDKPFQNILVNNIGLAGGGTLLKFGGDALLLFTDGLVEKRGVSIQEGLERLEILAADCDQDIETFCEVILASMVEGVISDDVALLAIRPLPLAGGLLLHVPAEPRVLAEAIGRELAAAHAAGRSPVPATAPGNAPYNYQAIQ